MIDVNKQPPDAVERGGQMTHPSVHAALTPEKIAYRMAGSGAALTYRELDERSNQVAHLFRALGLRPGGNVALMMENCLEFLVICWAAQRAGLYYTAISRFLKAEDVAFIIGDCGARVLVLSPAQRDALGRLELPGEVAVFVTGAGGDWETGLTGQPVGPVEDEVAGADMLYSSGTTGRPKGVKQALKGEPITSLHPLLRRLAVDMIGMSAESVYLSPAPLYHAAPLRFTMAAAALGGTAVIMEKFEPEACLALIEQHRVTHTQLVPTMFVRMLKLPEAVRARYDLGSLEGAVHAAAPCAPDVKEAMIAWWGPILLEYYAGTEANGVTVITTPEWLAHRGSVGLAVVGTIKIVDDESGEVLPDGRIGTVYFADGPTFAYHNNPALTAKSYHPNGWSTLGDVGYLDADGYLHLTDRKAYMIISGGVNIYPQEAEDALIAHPAVMDAAVFGIPDAEMGEAVHAVVQPVDFAQAGPELAAALIAHCRGRLAGFKSPKTISFDAELPRTPTGKLLKRLLRDRYWV
jgi:acyl-CoA synthetase (AMP-forming)/AMP-acid ligase II